MCTLHLHIGTVACAEFMLWLAYPCADRRAESETSLHATEHTCRIYSVNELEPSLAKLAL